MRDSVRAQAFVILFHSAGRHARRHNAVHFFQAIHSAVSKAGAASRVHRHPCPCPLDCAICHVDHGSPTCLHPNVLCRGHTIIDLYPGAPQRDVAAFVSCIDANLIVVRTPVARMDHDEVGMLAS